LSFAITATPRHVQQKKCPSRIAQITSESDNVILADSRDSRILQFPTLCIAMTADAGQASRHEFMPVRPFPIYAIDRKISNKSKFKNFPHLF
jgi:hypothetical protein